MELIQSYILLKFLIVKIYQIKQITIQNYLIIKKDDFVQKMSNLFNNF